MQAWCCKCKAKREMENESEGKTSRGVKMVKGFCKICHGKMCRIGGK